MCPERRESEHHGVAGCCGWWHGEDGPDDTSSVRADWRLALPTTLVVLVEASKRQVNGAMLKLAEALVVARKSDVFGEGWMGMVDFLSGLSGHPGATRGCG